MSWGLFVENALHTQKLVFFIFCQKVTKKCLKRERDGSSDAAYEFCEKWLRTPCFSFVRLDRLVPDSPARHGHWRQSVIDDDL